MKDVLNRNTILRILSRHRHKLKRFGVKKLLLFGSVARNEAKLGSDVDFLVEFEGPADFDSYMDLKFFLEDMLGTKVDLVTRKALKPQFLPYVEKESVNVT